MATTNSLGRPFMSNREEKLLRGSTDTSSVPMTPNVGVQRQIRDKVVSSKSPQRPDAFSKPKPAYTSPNPKQKRTDVAIASSQERSYEESPSKVMERKRN